METRMEQLEKVEKPKESEVIKMKLTNAGAFLNKYMIRATDFSFNYPNKMLWKPATFFIKGGEKAAIIGSNGSGKTTLIQQILSHSDGLEISTAMKIGYFAQNLSILKADQTVLENVKEGSIQTETIIRIVLAQLLFKQEDVYKPVKVLSGGERVKVALAKLIVGDYNTLILDEPTNFLDVPAIEALETLLSEYEGSIILVTHDRRFMESIAEKLLIIHDQQLDVFEGGFTEYQKAKDKPQWTSKEEERIRVENELASVLSQLSIGPSPDLEAAFQALLDKKRKLNEEG